MTVQYNSLVYESCLQHLIPKSFLMKVVGSKSRKTIKIKDKT